MVQERWRGDIDTVAPNAPVLDHQCNRPSERSGRAWFNRDCESWWMAWYDGSWSSPGNLVDDNATATDPAGNTSLPGTGTVSADITAVVA